MKHLDEKRLRQMYMDNTPLATIADEFGCCKETLYSRLEKMGLYRKNLPRFEDITGQRFGRLIALEFVRLDRFGKAIWKVHCDCGREKEINASGMKAGIVISCGCYKRERMSTGYKDISGSYWRKVHKMALQRGYEFTITMEQAWDIFLKQEKKCALSGISLEMWPDNNKYYLQTASLDRIDSNVGYIPENLQWVHKRVNFLKRDYSEEELVYWCRLITKKTESVSISAKSLSLRERRPLNQSIISIDEKQR